MTCRQCKKKLVGRSDKKFCTIKCKNAYHRKLNETNNTIVHQIDGILHRNYAIFKELMEEQTSSKMMIPRLILEKMGFNFNYYTGTYLNHQQKIYHYIYDFQWMEFSTQDVLLVKSDFTEKFKQ